MKTPNDSRPRSRYTGNGHWEPVENPEPVLSCAGSPEESITREWYREIYKNHIQDPAFVRAHLNGDWDACTTQTFTDPRVVVVEDPNDIWAHKPGSIEHREWQRKCDKAFNQIHDPLELRKDSTGVYKWES